MQVIGRAYSCLPICYGGPSPRSRPLTNCLVVSRPHVPVVVCDTQLWSVGVWGSSIGRRARRRAVPLHTTAAQMTGGHHEQLVTVLGNDVRRPLSHPPPTHRPLDGLCEADLLVLEVEDWHPPHHPPQQGRSSQRHSYRGCNATHTLQTWRCCLRSDPRLRACLFRCLRACLFTCLPACLFMCLPASCLLPV